MRRVRLLLLWVVSFAGSPAEPMVLGEEWEDARVLVVEGEAAPSTLEMVFWPGGEGLARRLAEDAVAMQPLPALPDDVLLEGGPVRVYIAPDATAFNRLAGGRAPEWSSGIAIPAARAVVLPGFASRRAEPYRLGRILRHELAHIALSDYLAPGRTPRWFNEGYAQWAAGEWGWEGAWRLWLAFATSTAPPLDSISLDWPDRGHDARIAYLLSVSAVGYLLEHGGGEKGMRIFLERWREGGDLEQALRQTYGLTLAQFEHAWLAEVRRRYGWGLLLTESIIFWTPLAGLFIILTIRRRRRMLERLEQMRAEEIPDSPAYWLGEVEAAGAEADEGEGAADGEGMEGAGGAAAGGGEDR